MRYLIMMLLLTSTVHAQSLLVNDTDEFTDMRRVISSFEDVGDGVSVNASYVGGNYYLGVTVVSDDWVMLGARKAYFVIDGKRSEALMFEIDSSIETGYVIEQYAIDVDDKMLLGGESIRCRIDGVVYDFSVVSDAVDLVERSI